MGGEQAIHGGLLAGADRGEEPDHRVGLGNREAAIHLGAQRAPAREAVLARDRELSLGEAGGVIRATHLLEPVLGELLEVLEAGTIGERHGVPFTRTVCRLDGCGRVY